MAELGEVLDGIAALVTAALYSNVTPIIGVDAVIGVGFPDSDELDRQLAAGNTFVSIFPQDGERSSVDWGMTPAELPRVPPSIAVTFDPAAQAATIVGTAGAFDVLGVQTDGNAYNVKVAAGDTAPAIAAKIAQTVPGAVAVGSVVTLHYATDTLFRVDTNGATLTPVAFRERQIQLNIWSPTQSDRDKVTKAVIAAINTVQFMAITTYDGLATEAVKLNYVSGTWSDRPQTAGGYMQSVVAKAGFHSTVLAQVPTILFLSTSQNGRSSLPQLNS